LTLAKFNYSYVNDEVVDFIKLKKIKKAELKIKKKGIKNE
jgi:hypothetical protein